MPLFSSSPLRPGCGPSLPAQTSLPASSNAPQIVAAADQPTPQRKNSLRPSRLKRCLGAGMVLSLAAGLAGAHDDDPKLLSLQPRHEGTGWRAAWSERPARALRDLGRDSDGLASLAASVDFGSNAVELLSWMPLGEFGSSATSANDCWGYSSPSGREYALIGLASGTGFVDLSNPSDARLITILPGPESFWRDIKTYDHYAYAVSEGGGGIQVFDLDQIDLDIVTELAPVLLGGTSERTHNVAIDEVSGFLYRTGGPLHGLRIYDLANPAAPNFVAQWNDRYVHDAQIVTYTSGPYAGRQIAFACSGFDAGQIETALDIIDVTDKNDIQVLANIEYSQDAAYSHQAWLNEDRSLLYLNDELDEDGVLPTTTYVINVSDIENPFNVSSFSNGNQAVGHNLYIDGDRLFAANYRSGLRIFDLAANPLNPPEVGYFDTWFSDDLDEFNSLWSIYPYFESGIVIGSDVEKGLFVWWPDEPELSFTYPNGLPSLIASGTSSIDVHIDEAEAGLLDPSSAQLQLDSGDGPISLPLVDLGNGDFRADISAAACGQELAFTFTARSTSGVTWRDPSSSAGDTYTAAVTGSQSTIFADDMETHTGWILGAAGDTATTGLWERGDPLASGAQAEDDHSPAGTMCWFTGQSFPGASDGFNDVDGGSTTLTSPVLDLSGLGDPVVRYWRWYSNSNFHNFDGDDVFEVEITQDGSNYVTVETVGPFGDETKGGWIYHQFRVRDFVPLSNNVRVRFIASDNGNGSIVEAALDDFEVVESSCVDCDENGLSDELELLEGAANDFNANGLLDRCEALSASANELSLSGGGAVAFDLDGGAPVLGATYWMFGSASGTTPGLNFGPINLPLQFDAYFQLTLSKPFAAPFGSFIGFFDGNGFSQASFSLPPGSEASLTGITLYHAYVASPTFGAPVHFASNFMPVTLMP